MMAQIDSQRRQESKQIGLQYGHCLSNSYLEIGLGMARNTRLWVHYEMGIKT